MSKRALIVGLASYANPKNNLDGVENDVATMVRVLSAHGITDLEILRDANATSENIRNALSALVTNAKSGDTRVFYYSGHGALLPADLSGTDDEDGRDEALVPYEGTLSSLILDNWMATFLKTQLKRDVFLWSIYDACHSGDMFKDAVVAGLPPPFSPDAQEKVLKVDDLVMDMAPRRLATRSAVTGATTKALILDGGLVNSVHIGAAEPEKTALVQQIDGMRRSVCTCAIERSIAAGQNVVQFEGALAAAQAKLTNHHKPQVACSAANKTKALFS